MSIAIKPKSFVKPKLNKWLLGLLLFVPIIGIGYFAYNQFVVVPQQQAKNKVQTAVVERSNLTISVSANGTVQPERSVNVSPKTSDILKQLLVKEGDTVQQGQVLAYMDNSNLRSAITSGSGNLPILVRLLPLPQQAVLLPLLARLLSCLSHPQTKS